MVTAMNLFCGQRLARLCWLFIFCAGSSAALAATSELWGEHGEKWSPQSRLPDFSFAGYQRGEAQIPTLPVKANVRNFGAKGDGLNDDTAAFRAAIASTSSGAILVPAGRYKITGLIPIDKPNIVLRGEGPQRSILFFPKTLTDVKPVNSATASGKPTIGYSWSGGFVCIGREAFPKNELAAVVAPFAKRGDEWLPVSRVEGISVGQWVDVKVSDDPGLSLARWIYNGDSGSLASLTPQSPMQVAKVAQIDATSKRLRIDRPLRLDIRAEWHPVVEAFNPEVVNSGVESLGFEFPPVPYLGHFTEQGANPLEIKCAAHCWIRDVRIVNCDSGIFIRGGVHCTVSGVVLVSDRKPAGKDTGHHGISLYGADNLIAGFDFQQRFIHDISVESAASAGNVFARGKGRDLCFDHHTYATFSNLFTDIDCGAGTRAWFCGGGKDLGKNSGCWTTFWNLRAAKKLTFPPASFSPMLINVVGIPSADAPVKIPDGKWFEPLTPESLVPQDLHAAQLARRLGGK